MREGVAKCKQMLWDWGIEVENLPEDVTTIGTEHTIATLLSAQLAAPPESTVAPDTYEQYRAYLLRLLPPIDIQATPYAGLQTFQFELADRFFGRDQLLIDLVERLAHAQFLVLLGASGSGKSSIVLAGLWPLLKAGGLPGSEHWCYLSLRPGARPLNMLAAALTAASGGSIAEGLDMVRRLADAHTLLNIADMLRTRLVLIVDQAEELWTLQPTEPDQLADWLEQQQRPFIRLLMSVFDAPDRSVLVILSLRTDFLHRAADQPAFARAITDHDILVSPMGAEELRAAIAQPAKQFGGSFEPGLVEELLAKTQNQDGMLPLLEYTLQELWAHRQANGLMTWAAYHTLGGIEGALARRADALLSQHYTPEQEHEVRRLLLRLIQPGEGVADTRRRVALQDLTLTGQTADDIQMLLQPLINARLLISSQMLQQPPTVEVSHEALIRSWPKLHGWIDEYRVAMRLQLQLEQAAKEWQSNAQAKEYLWPRRRIAGLEQSLAQAHLVPNELERRFLFASHEEDRFQGRRIRQMRFLRLTSAWLFLILASIGFWQILKDPLLRKRADDSGPQVLLGKIDILFDSYEVTNERYQMCLTAEYCLDKPSEINSTYYKQNSSKLPVTGIDALGAARFCQWLQRRLPTFPEWEDAATQYGSETGPWGKGSLPLNYGNINLTSPVTVGETIQGRLLDRSIDNIYDLTGNVQEWTSSTVSDEGKVLEVVTENPYGFTSMNAVAGISFEDEIFADDPSTSNSNEGIHYKWWSNMRVEEKSRSIGFRCVKDA